MLDRKVLKQINKMEKEHCQGCTKIIGISHKNFAFKVCQECPIGKEIRHLGTKVEITKAQQVLKKGKDMTFKDICFCIENQVDIKVIKKAAGLNRGKTFKTYMNRHGRDTWGRKLVN